MKRFVFSLAMLTPASAFAHGGAHIHPHGMENSLLVMGIGLASVIVIGLSCRKR